jgi:hypothetical protein
MPIFRLGRRMQGAFAEAREMFANVQLGIVGETALLIIGCQVAIGFDEQTPSDLERFYRTTWGLQLLRGPMDTISLIGIVERYDSWIRSLPEIDDVEPRMITREELTRFVASSFPPPPPNRPTLVPRYPPPPSLPQNFYGHLPFKTTTLEHEHFYRFEPWPNSRKITVGDPGTIAAETYASPSAELRFLNTGFAAVARNALPSFFPAVFRYELQPPPFTDIHCGAIIPNFGQSGGGVEVYFPAQVRNQGPIANPVVIPPL